MDQLCLSLWANCWSADRTRPKFYMKDYRPVNLKFAHYADTQLANFVVCTILSRDLCGCHLFFLPTLSVYTTQPVAQPAVQLFVSRIRCVTHSSPCRWMVRCGASFVSFTRCRSQQVRYFCCDHRRLTLSWTYNRVWGPRRTKCVSFIRERRCLVVNDYCTRTDDKHLLNNLPRLETTPSPNCALG